MIDIKELKILCDKLSKNKDKVKTEEATKTSMIMPFLAYLGYDVFNPKEFIPEYVADFGVKRGEKVDYAIRIARELTIIIEAKQAGKNLDNDVSQLFRYFSVTEAKFAILTNGTEYRFYTDIEQKNIMDKEPFHTIYIDALCARDIDILEAFNKSNYNYENAYRIANLAKIYNKVFDFVASVENNTKMIEIVAACLGMKDIDAGRERVIGKALFDSIVGEGDTLDDNKFISSIGEEYGQITTYSECDKPKILRGRDKDSRDKGEYYLTQEELNIVDIVEEIIRNKVTPNPTKFSTRLYITDSKGKEQTLMVLYRNGEDKPVWGFSITGYNGKETSGSRNSIKYTGDSKELTKYKNEIAKASKL